ncbi:fatty acyl-AMP ligase [Amycolatopsis sp. lyj-112]|uniref:fatty acyl-AMP ligase n=1 Tax=Amycolatopsis sp. lyj-112 TaxID=2789288 RepID=UPI0039782662
MSANYLEHLRSRFDEFGDDRSVLFFRETTGGLVADELGYHQLDVEARRIASLLASRAAPGDRVLLLYPPGLEFLSAFLGCVYAGVIAVPAPMASFGRADDKVAAIMVDAGARAVLTTASRLDEVRGRHGGAVSFCLATDDRAVGDPDSWRAPAAGERQPVYLQYTSGSTSDPKGVMVTAGNLLHNGENMRACFGSGSDTTVVAWLPHFHDMGLVGTLLHTIDVGARGVFTAPLTVIKHPFRWLELITRFRGTLTLAPDFAYELCTTAITDAQLSTLDLSSLRTALSGAEPVRCATQEEFTRRFAPAGFRREMFMAGYGLAEVTLVASTSAVGTAPAVRDIDADLLGEHKVRLVEPGSGARLTGHGFPRGFDLRIVVPDTGQVLTDGEVGEIWLRGPSVTAGYWNRPEATAEDFQARTSEGDGPFLRTGDLGFVLEGELFITGRRKDMIILQGRNIYPQDLEFLVRPLHPALAAKPGAAFAVDTGQEHVVLVQEVRPGLLGDLAPGELTSRMRQAITDAFDVPYPSIVLVTAPVPRTTSGKVRRGATRDLFLDDELVAVHEDLAPSVRSWRANLSRV